MGSTAWSKRREKDGYHILISENDHIYLFSCPNFRKSYIDYTSFPEKISKPFSCSLYVGDKPLKCYEKV